MACPERQRLNHAVSPAIPEHLAAMPQSTSGIPMRMDKLTSRFQQALQEAQSLAVGRDHNIVGAY